MSVRELLEAAARAVEDSELADAISQKNEKSNEQFKKKAERLLACFNAIQSDVAINYLAPTARVDLTRESTQLDDISSRLIRIVGVYTKEGNYAVDYDICGDALIVNGLGVYAVYEYIPEDSDIEGEFYYKDKIIGKRAFVYGVCAEYCLLEMRYEESSNWESRYRQAVEIKTDYKRRRLKASNRWGL